MPNPQEEIIANIRARIEECGCSVIAVGAEPGLGIPQFAYTVGVFHRWGYEFAMSGCGIAAMHNVLNELARRAMDGKLTPRDGQLVEGALGDGYLLRLKEVHPSWQEFGWMAPTLCILAQPTVWQAQFPDRAGRFPGEPGYDLTALAQLDYSRPREP